MSIWAVVLVYCTSKITWTVSQESTRLLCRSSFHALGIAFLLQTKSLHSPGVSLASKSQRSMLLYVTGLVFIIFSAEIRGEKFHSHFPHGKLKAFSGNQSLPNASPTGQVHVLS